MPTAQLMPSLRQQFRDANGVPVANGTVTFYAAGTTNLQAAYQDATATQAHPNPLTLDSNGEAEIWLRTDLAYKFVVQDTSSNVVETVDLVRQNNLSSIISEMIDWDLAGTGLTLNASNKLDVNVDNSTVEINSGNIRVKASGADTQVFKANGSGGGAWGAVKSVEITRSIRNVSVPGSTTAADDTVILSGATFTLTLHSAVGQSGKQLRLLHNGSHFTAYTLATSEDIIAANGNIVTGNYQLYTKGEMLLLESDGTNWYVIEHKTDTGDVTETAVLKGSTTDPVYPGIGHIQYYIWNRRGNKMKLHFEYSHASAGTNGSGVVLLPLPVGASLDDDTYVFWSSVSQEAKGVVGSGGHLATGPFTGHLDVRMYSRNKLQFMLTNTGNAWTQFTYATSSFATPIWQLSCNAELPILGWQP